MAYGGTLCLLLSSLFLPSALVESSNCRFDADTYSTLHPATAFRDTWKEDHLRSGPFPRSPSSPEPTKEWVLGSKRLDKHLSAASPEPTQDGVLGSKRLAKHLSPASPEPTQDGVLGSKRLAKNLSPVSPEATQEGALGVTGLLYKPPTPAQVRWLCYNDTRALCWCTVSELDCSDNNGSLTFVPEVEGNFTFLNFTYNALKNVPEDFFHNVTRISRLDLGDNYNLSYIHPLAFQPLRELRELYLDYDYALMTKNWKFLEPVFSVRTLTRLDLRVGDLGPMPHDLFYRHPLPRLETLYFHFNNLQLINMTALRPLSNLTTFGAASNNLKKIVSDFAPALDKLNLRYNSLNSFPITCYENGDGTRRSYYPKLTQVLFMDNKIKYIFGNVCLPLLSYLDLSKNYIRIVYPGMFSVQQFPRLEELYLQDMPHLSEIRTGAFANPALRTLSVMYNNFYFNPRNVSSESFQGLPGLQNLLLGHNHISDQNFVRIFRHLAGLQYIHLGSNSIKDISKETFSGFVHLSTLCMYQNQVTALPEGAFDSLTQLSTLDINDNLIATVPPSAFSLATRQRLNHADLSQNPFRCDCNILWFKAWLQSSPLLFSHSRGAYECQNVHQTIHPSGREPSSVASSDSTDPRPPSLLVSSVSTNPRPSLLASSDSTNPRPSLLDSSDSTNPRPSSLLASSDSTNPRPSSLLASSDSNNPRPLSLLASSDSTSLPSSLLASSVSTNPRLSSLLASSDSTNPRPSSLLASSDSINPRSAHPPTSQRHLNQGSRLSPLSAQDPYVTSHDSSSLRFESLPRVSHLPDWNVSPILKPSLRWQQTYHPERSDFEFKSVSPKFTRVSSSSFAPPSVKSHFPRQDTLNRKRAGSSASHHEGTETAKVGHRLKVVDFSMPTQACLLDHKTSVLIVVVVGLVIAVIAVVAPCYRYRWHLRLLWHQQLRGRGEGGRNRRRNRRSRRADRQNAAAAAAAAANDANSQYDVFVSYAQRDLAWVLQALLPQLEGRLGLRLFIMDRDSVPGRLIAEEILRGIEASSRVLMVFSRTFARDKDKWCQFQLAQALRHVLETDDALEVVCLDDVTRSRELPLQMLAVFRILRYIQWGDGSEARASFWGCLEESFGDLI